MSDIQRIAARIKPYVQFKAGGMQIDVRKWLSQTNKGKGMSEIERKAHGEQEQSCCPFCGSMEVFVVDQWHETGEYWVAGCNNPYCSLDVDRARVEGRTKEQAVRAWNTRYPMAATQQPQGVPEDVQRDASRYRWLRRSLYREWLWVGDAEIGMRVHGACPEEAEVDAAIDDRLAAAPSAEGQG